MTQSQQKTLLEYYREHQITPVCYDLNNLEAHLERRSSLYAKLGLLPFAFRNTRILEIAAGTGHNSLYLAQCLPKQLILLEPNDSGLEHIHETYKNFVKPHTIPAIIPLTLEDYTPERLFEIVICENWLGTSSHEQALLQKLSTFVATNGVLVVTSVSPIGIVPNLLRRFLSVYLSTPTDAFEQRTAILVDAFANHLNTLAAMTRNKKDWVQDNMINPTYFKLCLSIPNLINRLGDRFEVLSSLPNFAEDWRWFKSMHGEGRRYNELFLLEYYKKSHNFIDYRQSPNEGNAKENLALETKSLNLLYAIEAHEEAFIKKENVTEFAKKVVDVLDDLMLSIPKHFEATIKGFNEVRDLINSPQQINVNTVANLAHFNILFGREVAYLSFVRNDVGQSND